MSKTDEIIDKLRYYGTEYAIGDNLGREIDGTGELMLEVAELLELIKLDRDTAYVEMNRLKSENAVLKARLDKAVELPCEFGDTVYVLMQRNTTIEVVKGTFKNIRRYDDDVWWVVFSDLWVDKTLDDFGKTVFLTETEAQAKLDEMKGGADK